MHPTFNFRGELQKMNFNQKHAIITGGSSGIGKATAKLLAKSGANITIIARSPEKLETAKAEIEAVKLQSEQRVCTKVADVSDRIQVEIAIRNSVQELGVPDILITSAGISVPGYFQDLPIELFERTMAINYFGSLYAVRAVLAYMKPQKKGNIVLISSGAGLIGIYGYTPYSPSKFALRGLAESLRGELKPLGIQVTIVYPPDTDTPQLEAENQTKPPETKQITETAKMWKPEDIAREIIVGIKNNTFAIAPGIEMTLLSRLHSLLAPGLNWYFDRIVTQNQTKT
ncbi:SDR family oxidoreductase [Lyngbya sp. PCC 8106]|uniref:SDR family oxidoreductase n=1 Tax=Lyngbya sp. (strain PCC 8106) TaxID=313612 RepID=UPI0000EACC13|nr:SDR family oxidoreductase [Lyngbya sp. PCC 8106]EAW37894.1 ribitol type dehydrogenase protein [Lyngbya sp. PCC 8106]